MDRKEREAAVLEYIRLRDGWITSVEMAKALGIPKGTLTGTLGRMVSEGKLTSRVPALGGGYRWAGEPMDTMHDDPAPDGPSGAAPASSCPPEQPADVAPASESLPPQAGLAPFAGLILHELVEGREQDAELRVLTMLDDLDDARRERVLQYAVDRWWLK